MNGYSIQAMPEDEVKTTSAPSRSKTTTRGASHHFFSCRRNAKNSLSRDHMLRRKARTSVPPGQTQSLVGWPVGLNPNAEVESEGPLQGVALENDLD